MDAPVQSTEEGKDTYSPCVRCKERPAEHDLRSENVCTPCFTQYVQNKAIKRLELLQRETRGPKLTTRPQKYCLALSRGVSSTCLLDVLYDNILQQRSKGQRVKFELSVVAVIDDDLLPLPDGRAVAEGEEKKASSHEDGSYETEEIKKFRKRFPETEMCSIPLSSVLGLDSIDWSALPSTEIPKAATATATAEDNNSSSSNNNPSTRLAYLFSQLPSATSRADVRRLLTRHLLLSTAIRSACDVLLLGYNTTSLAELTLSETAKGRGFALPWMVNDGVLPLPRSMMMMMKTTDQSSKNAKSDGSGVAAGSGIPVYNPMRDIYRKELYVYLASEDTSSSSSAGTTTEKPSSPLSSLLSASLVATIQSATRPTTKITTGNTSSGSGGGREVNSTHGAVISHRDLSIDDVMARYFADVEANYPSVVANVVRTTGKLSRLFSGMDLAADHDHHHEHDDQDSGDDDKEKSSGNDMEDESQESVEEKDEKKKKTTTTKTKATTGRCGICGLVLDESGNERWRGEIGEEKGNGKGRGKLCYGCERAILG